LVEGKAERELRERLLRDGAPTVRQNAAWALGRLGASLDLASLKALRQALAAADVLVCRDAARALGDTAAQAHSDIIEAVRKAATSTDPRLRLAVQEALRKLGQ
jgi:HEAT repeat protein